MAGLRSEGSWTSHIFCKLSRGRDDFLGGRHGEVVSFYSDFCHAGPYAAIKNLNGMAVGTPPAPGGGGYLRMNTNGTQTMYAIVVTNRATMPTKVLLM